MNILTSGIDGFLRSIIRNVAFGAFWLHLAAIGCKGEPAQSAASASNVQVANVNAKTVEADASSSTKSGLRPPREPFTVSLLPTRRGWANLVDVTETSGVDFVHTDGEGGTRYIVQTVVTGMALFDYDNDGWIDIYFLNGAPNPGANFANPRQNALYRNNGDWTFTDVTDLAGVGDTGYGLGVTCGDYDGDGDQDLYVNNFGPSVFYRNNGDGTFTDVTAASGTGCDKCAAGAAFLDIEGDGLLDLYVANYVDFSYEKNVTESIGDRVYSAGPLSYNPEPDVLFRNNGDGRFLDISRESGIAAVRGNGMGMVCADFDDDGDTDVFVACDNWANQLFRNDGTGKFEEVALASGVAYDLDGASNGSMGVTCGDFDGDGKLDLYVTNFSGELSVLYRNSGEGFFTDMTRPSKASTSTFSHAKWGTMLADFDHDADLDLFIACGHFWIDARYVDDRTDVKVPNALLENQGDGTFVDVSSQSGTGMAIIASSKGAGCDDLDNDGDLDVVVLNANDKPSIMRNDLETPRKSVQITLRGEATNREGVGARVKVATEGREQVAEVHRGQGYQSHYGNRLHFGLGEAETISRIEVRWIGGGTDVVENPPDSPLLLIYEGGRCESLAHLASPSK